MFFKNLARIRNKLIDAMFGCPEALEEEELELLDDAYELQTRQDKKVRDHKFCSNFLFITIIFC